MYLSARRSAVSLDVTFVIFPLFHRMTLSVFLQDLCVCLTLWRHWNGWMQSCCRPERSLTPRLHSKKQHVGRGRRLHRTRLGTDMRFGRDAADQIFSFACCHQVKPPEKIKRGLFEDQTQFIWGRQHVSLFLVYLFLSQFLTIHVTVISRLVVSY